MKSSTVHYAVSSIRFKAVSTNIPSFVSTDMYRKVAAARNLSALNYLARTTATGYKFNNSHTPALGM